MHPVARKARARTKAASDVRVPLTPSRVAAARGRDNLRRRTVGVPGVVRAPAVAVVVLPRVPGAVESSVAALVAAPLAGSGARE